MRRNLVAVISAALLVVPALSATAQSCAPISGNAMFDFGRNIGVANVDYDGERLRVPFYAVGFEETGEGTADIYFVWEFPQGDVLLVEHSTNLSKGGPAAEFNSTIDVLDGGSGEWSWSGTSNVAAGRAAVGNISGDLCIDD